MLIHRHRIQRWVQEDTSRITATANAYFEGNAMGTLERVESLYPITTQCLFEAARSLVEGKWGKKLKAKFIISSERISSPRQILTLLVVYISHYEAPFPEIFLPVQKIATWFSLIQMIKEYDDEEIEQMIVATDSHPIREIIDNIEIDPKHLQALMQIFDHFLDILTYPSVQLVHLFLQYQHRDKALQTALSIENIQERSESLSVLIEGLLSENQMAQALELWSHISDAREKHVIAMKMVAQMVESGHTDQALGFVAFHPKHRERDLLTKEIALKISQKGDWEKALDIVRTIDDKDLQLFTLSRIVKILAGQNKMHIAREIALSILDENYKQDALVEIVKTLISFNRMDEAIRFVDSLGKGEKNKPTQVIQKALKAHHLNAEARRGRERT